MAEALERGLPALPAGGGVTLLTYTQALVAGLYPMTDPAAPVQAALHDPALAPLCLTLEAALPGALRALYSGLTQPGDMTVNAT
ncbi:hypothetical protein [Deinococcus malanensis]|uniref:hypothetical protein n=1 Tax=Deinococcus malanensis TaxID=1706855 RepID=UPI001E3DE6B7|nr:hypothetical protein [Deinococcus malanensis]